MAPPRRDLRVSDADRERAAEELRHHYGAGRLTDDELAERVDGVYGARTASELQALTVDLPSAHGTPAQPRRRSALEAGVRIHVVIYVVVNVLLVGIWAAAGGGYFWPVWSILGWGIGVGCHAAPLLAGRGQPRRSPHAPELSSVDAVATSVA